MNSATFTLVIYFVGIAAMVDREGGGKLAIFPTARNGAYGGHALSPHTTYLHLQGADFLNEKGQPHPNPQAHCTGMNGKWDDGICSIELTGAKLWTETAETFTAEPTFKDKVPSFHRLCNEASSVKKVYTEKDPNPKFVAARFEMTGGVASGCSRKYGAFVTKLTTKSTDGVLFVKRGASTLGIRLRNEARLSVENRPDHVHESTENCSEEGRKHFGWYYFMANGASKCPINCPTKLADHPQCDAMPGITEPVNGPPSASGPDCGNTNYP